MARPRLRMLRERTGNASRCSAPWQRGLARDGRRLLERMAPTGRDRSLVSAGTVGCHSPGELVDSILGWRRAIDWHAAGGEVDDFRRGGAGDSLLLFARGPVGSVLCRRMVACLRLVRVEGHAQTLAISRTLVLSILFCDWRGIFDGWRSMVRRFTVGFATRWISRAYRIVDCGSFPLRGIPVRGVCRTDLSAASRGSMEQ